MDWRNADVVRALDAYRGGTIATLEELRQEVQRVTGVSVTVKTLSLRVRHLRTQNARGRPPMARVQVS